MKTLTERILEQNVLEEHKQVHDLHVRIKELIERNDRLLQTCRELRARAEAAEAELNLARKARGNQAVAEMTRLNQEMGFYDSPEK